jgi:hypothetical protein
LEFPFGKLKTIVPSHIHQVHYCLQDILCDSKKITQRLKIISFERLNVVKFRNQYTMHPYKLKK